MAHPQVKATTFDASAPGANTDIFGSDLTPSFASSAFRITISLQGSAIVNVQETDGNTTVSYDLDDGNQLGADTVHTFDLPVRESRSYNFQLETDSAINRFDVEEISVAEV